MSKQLVSKRVLRQRRVRAKIVGTKKRPRLSVKISNHNVSAQIIDDTKKPSESLAYSTSQGQKLPTNLMARAEWVGKDISKKAKTAKINRVVLDRGSLKYHGRIKKLADTARDGGLEF